MKSKRAERTREHILNVASDLFYKRGIRAVGVDTIVAEAGIAKMTLYNHFESKDELICAYLQRERTAWLKDLAGFMGQGRKSASEKIDCLFDLLSQETRQLGYHGCHFVNGFIQLSDDAHSAQPIVKTYMQELRDMIRTLAHDAGAAASDDVGDQIFMLLKGATVLAMITGDTESPQKAKLAAQKLILQTSRRPLLG